MGKKLMTVKCSNPACAQRYQVTEDAVGSGCTLCGRGTVLRVEAQDDS